MLRIIAVYCLVVSCCFPTVSAAQTWIELKPVAFEIEISDLAVGHFEAAKDSMAKLCYDISDEGRIDGAIDHLEAAFKDIQVLQDGNPYAAQLAKHSWEHRFLLMAVDSQVDRLGNVTLYCRIGNVWRLYAKTLEPAARGME